MGRNVVSLAEKGPKEFILFDIWSLGSVLSLTTYSFENGTTIFNIRHMLQDRTRMVSVVLQTAVYTGIVYSAFCILILLVPNFLIFKPFQTENTENLQGTYLQKFASELDIFYYMRIPFIFQNVLGATLSPIALGESFEIIPFIRRHIVDAEGLVIRWKMILLRTLSIAVFMSLIVISSQIEVVLSFTGSNISSLVAYIIPVVFWFIFRAFPEFAMS